MNAKLTIGVVGLLALTAGPAAAQPKPKPAPKACGVTAIPLSVGNEWVYEPSLPPPDKMIPEASIRTTPVQPKKLTIKVTAIDVKPEGTTVTLSEDLDGKAHTTTIMCTGGGAKYQISPTAFWFAGEPGTIHGLELTDIQRKGQTLGLTAGKITALEWWDDVLANWKHVPVGKAKPKMSKGTIEIKRHWVLQPEEKLTMKDGTERKTIKVGLETSVVMTIDPPPKEPLRQQEGVMVNMFWFVDGTGPVQVLNSFGQQYALTTFKIQ